MKKEISAVEFQIERYDSEIQKINLFWFDNES